MNTEPLFDYDKINIHAAKLDRAEFFRRQNRFGVGPYVQTWLMTVAILVGGTGVVAFIDTVISSMPSTSLAKFECMTLDKAASGRVALLVSDDSADGNLRLDEALAQLRLARQHCHGGAADVIARVNYEALDQLPTNKPTVAALGD
jgi:hypothetical protein